MIENRPKMNKEDLEINFFNCDFCNKLLVEPTKLPCGNTICISHLQELFGAENIFECILCYKNHPLPQSCLKRPKIELIFNQVFSECKQKIEEAIQKVQSVELLVKHPECFINERFDLITRHINWRRQDLKKEIDKYADELVQSVEQSRFSCIELSKENYQHKEKIESSRAELEELKSCLETYEIDHLVGDAKFKQIKASANDLESKLSRMLVEYEDTLLLNKDYLFVFFDRPMEDVLGNVIDRNKIESTNVLLEKEAQKEPQLELLEVQKDTFLEIPVLLNFQQQGLSTQLDTDSLPVTDPVSMSLHSNEYPSSADHHVFDTPGTSQMVNKANLLVRRKRTRKTKAEMQLEEKLRKMVAETRRKISS